MHSICLTFDDFSQSLNNLDYIEKLKRKFPGFCCTMFTIPTRCTRWWLEYINQRFPYIEMVQHSFWHTPDEFKNMKYDEAKYKIELGFRKQFYKLFKGARWGINDEVQKALKDLGYAVALDIKYQHQKPIDGIKYFEFNAVHNNDWNNYINMDIISHGHLGDFPDNGLLYCFNNLMKLPEDREWKWASECLIESKEEK